MHADIGNYLASLVESKKAPVVADMKGKGPAVAQKKEAVLVAAGGLKINDNVPRASSHAMYQPSHCVFNLAAFKAVKGPSLIKEMKFSYLDNCSFLLIH